MRVRHVLAVLLTSTLISAGPAVAAVARPPQFSITLRGSQSTVWSFDQRADPASCAPEQRAAGSQLIRFGTSSPAFTEAKRLDDGSLSLLEPHGLDWELAAHVERESEQQVDGSMLSPQQCPAVGQGGGAPGKPPQQDCGTRAGAIRLEMDFNPWGLPESAYRTGPDHYVRDHLVLEGIEPAFPGGLGAGFSNCPLGVGTASYGEYTAELLPAAGRLPERWLNDPSRHVITVHASGQRDLRSGGAHLHTIVTYNLTLRRIG